MAKFRIETLSNIANLTKELATGLRNITFSDNFTAFEESDLTIAANTEAKIRNKLTIKPTKYIIIYQTGNALVTAGDTAWSDDFLYLKNHDSSNSATVSVLFLR